VAKSEIDFVRRSVRVIRMVSELHRMGYQHARIMPHEYPLAYRIVIAPRSRFSLLNGAYAPGAYEDPCARYSSAQENRYFDWTDAAADNARQLAEKFVDRFPDLLAACQGSDWAYAGWLSDLLATLDQQTGRLPIVMAENLEPGPETLRALPLRLYGKTDRDDPRDVFFPLPPMAA
jgi:hypothetical protein